MDVFFHRLAFFYFNVLDGCAQYADLSGFVYAEDSEEASELAVDNWNIHEEEYTDSDSSGDSDYNYDEMEITLEESDIDVHEIPARNNTNTFNPVQTDLPNHYLEDLPALASL